MIQHLPVRTRVNAAFENSRVRKAFDIFRACEPEIEADQIQSDLVQAALEATRRVGVEPQPDVGSTDANLPMSLGISAVALGGGGSGGKIHTPEEWFDPTRRELALQRLLGLVAALAVV